MALKSKLFLAFSIMILLSVFTALISIRAFRAANDSIGDVRSQADYVVRDLIPANERWLNISAQVISAGLNYYAYALSFETKNHELGNSEIAAVDREFAELDKVLAAAAADRLPNSRTAIVECRRGVEELKTLARRANAIDANLKKLNESFVNTQDEITAIAEDQYNVAYDALKEMLDRPAGPPAETGDGEEDEGHAGGTAAFAGHQAEIDAKTGRLEFLSDLFDFVAWSNKAFWRGQSYRGTAAKQYFDELQEHMAGLIARVDQYNTPENVPDERERGLFNQAKSISGRLIAISEEIEEAFLTLEKLTDDLDAVANATGAKARAAARQTAEAVLANANAMLGATSAVDRTVARAEWLQFAVLAGTVLIGMLLAWFITRNIVTPIDRAIAELNRGSGVIANAANHIASASQSLAEGASEQSSSLEETSAALEQISSMSQMSAENAAKANTQTRDTVGLIQAGSESMQEMSAAMSEINERSEKVSQIIKTIEDIAFQTNLLALNAAVEAARAGEAGKGFAVVADEVRNLSQRSAAAARDTTALIQGTVESIRNGSGITSRLDSSYREIQEGTKGISGLIEQIAQAANEQAQGVEQVNHALARMDTITQTNSASSEETASASNDLTSQMGMLHNTIGELSALVHGSGRHAPPPPPREQPRRAAPAPAKAKAAPARLAPPEPASPPAVMRPNDVIPLEGDFDDF